MLAVVEYEGGASGVVEGQHGHARLVPVLRRDPVLGERGVLDHGFRAAPAEDGGNIGGDVQSFLRLHPAVGTVETLAVEGGDPWVAEIAYFADCVESGTTPETATGVRAREALRVALAVNGSLASGRPEPV